MSRETKSKEEQASRRVQSLDVLRGVAIIGTLLTNIWIFAIGSGGDPVYLLGKSEEFLGPLSNAVSNGKFLGLLSILFGVGMAIQFESAVRNGLRWPWRYEWRSLLLLADGFVHFALVMQFDILMGYALVGMVIAPLLLLRTRWLVVATVVAGALHLALEFNRMMAGRSAGGRGGDDDWAQGFGGGSLGGAFGGAWDGDVPTTYFAEVADRMENFWALREEAFIIAPPLSAFLFLCGVLLWRAGLFSGDARAHAMSRRFAVGGLTIGGTLTAWEYLPLPGKDIIGALSRYTVAPIVAFGYLGLILILLRRRGGSGFLSRRLADVGRTALSCYMLQNVVAIVAFSQWGLDLGPFGPLGTVLSWAAISALLMLGAWWWLRHFRQGPFELVWRWAVDIPFRRADRRRQEKRDEDEKRATADRTSVGAP
ncbi:DUF418 domain-containing protein [Streptomyces sp. ND04-05B]|uniref:DUF418 domain-containing protein n=1 Tax=Streptomyces sp. ND04-05B TaxID=3028693 RepID=UPI0029B15C4F|nr:DUF418 domain-containing protein [Streptomyces sp. ND04-05B]MDX3069308.1 DUF418 domain-containing protein [Streptomyces sp. ND04-05B]